MCVSRQLCSTPPVEVRSQLLEMLHSIRGYSTDWDNSEFVFQFGIQCPSYSMSVLFNVRVIECLRGTKAAAHRRWYTLIKCTEIVSYKLVTALDTYL